MAKSDIRITYGFTDHPKTVKMIARLGEPSFRAIIRLWCWVAHNRPKGILTKMNAEDIGIVAGWTNGTEFVDVLVDVGFLNKRGRGLYSIHDWKDNQPYVWGSPERSEMAKNAAKSKHSKVANDLASAEIEKPHSGNEETALRKTENRIAPSPSPSPYPIPSPIPSPVPEKTNEAHNAPVKESSQGRIPAKEVPYEPNEDEW